MITILIMVLAILVTLAALVWFAFEAGMPDFLWECGARLRSWNKRRRERRFREYMERLEDLTK
jgi:uncharacterized protein HemY